MESRHDWAKMVFTPGLFKYVLFQMLPEVIMHSKDQDETQIRDNYDRTSAAFTRALMPLIHSPSSYPGGDDFYGWYVECNLSITAF